MIAINDHCVSNLKTSEPNIFSILKDSLNEMFFMFRKDKHLVILNLTADEFYVSMSENQAKIIDI